MLNLSLLNLNWYLDSLKNAIHTNDGDMREPGDRRREATVNQDAMLTTLRAQGLVRIGRDHFVL